MQQPAILLTCAMLAAASSLAIGHNPYFNDDYLDTSLMPNNWNINIENTKAALIALNVRGKLPKNILGRIKYLLSELESEPNKSGINLHQIEVYTDLINLTNLDHHHTDKVVTRVVEICEILKNPLFVQGKEFADFLLQYGPSKFGPLVKAIGYRLLRGSRDRNHAIRDLDRVFVALSGTLTHFGGITLQSLNLATSVFHIEDGIRVVQSWEQLNDLGKKKPLCSLYLFILVKCDELRRGREFDFLMLSLARTFKYSFESSSDGVKKLIEYNRLCASLRPDEVRIKANLFRQINWDSWPNQAVLDLDELFAASYNRVTYDDDTMLKILKFSISEKRVLNVNKAIEVAVKLEKWMEEEVDAIRFLLDFIFRKCTLLQSGHEFLLHQMSLTSTSGHYWENLPTEVKKWKEYNRLCESWRNDELTVSINLAEQMNRQNFSRQESNQSITRDFLSVI